MSKSGFFKKAVAVVLIGGSLAFGAVATVNSNKLTKTNAELTESNLALKAENGTLKDELEALKNAETVTSASNFTFRDGVLTGYNGPYSNVVIPTSYSLGELVAKTITFNNFEAYRTYFQNQRIFDFEVVAGEPNDFVRVTNEDEFMSSEVTVQELINTYGTITCNYAIQTYVDGDDFEVQQIGPCAFEQNKYIKSVTIPEGVFLIDENAFAHCEQLSEVILPESLIEIRYDAFRGDYNINSITLPNKLEQIGQEAFSSCYTLKSIVIPDSVTSLGDFMFQHCVSLESVTLSKNIEVIPVCAFDFCANLKEVNFGENTKLTGIYENAFCNCTSLETITIPETVTFIDTNAFMECRNLKTVYLDSEHIASNPAQQNYGVLATVETIYLKEGLSTNFVTAFSYTTDGTVENGYVKYTLTV